MLVMKCGSCGHEKHYPFNERPPRGDDGEPPLGGSKQLWHDKPENIEVIVKLTPFANVVITDGETAITTSTRAAAPATAATA